MRACRTLGGLFRVERWQRASPGWPRNERIQMMLVGSYIVHALHGLGIVESIEEKLILGRVTRFSVVAFDHLRILMNVEQSNSLVRPLIDVTEVEKVLEFLREANDEQPPNHNRRYMINLERMKSGDIRQLCGVVKSLSKLSQAKKLGHKDHSMLERAREVLAQELSHVTSTGMPEMQALIDENCQIGLETTLAV